MSNYNYMDYYNILSTKARYGLADLENYVAKNKEIMIDNVTENDNIIELDIVTKQSRKFIISFAFSKEGEFIE